MLMILVWEVLICPEWPLALPYLLPVALLSEQGGEGEKLVTVVVS